MEPGSLTPEVKEEPAAQAMTGDPAEWMVPPISEVAVKSAPSCRKRKRKYGLPDPRQILLLKRRKWFRFSPFPKSFRGSSDPSFSMRQTPWKRFQVGCHHGGSRATGDMSRN